MISVIIPYWNSAEWIGRCVKNLKSQDGDFEFLFVNDKSTDDSKEIVQKLTAGDDRFALLDNAHHKGVSGARNTGIEKARGEWITFLDADDEMLAGAYSTFVMVIAADLRANIHQMNHLRYYTAINKVALKYTNERGIFSADNLPSIWFGVWNKIFRAEFLRDIRFSEALQYGEDGLFILQCLAKDNYIHHASRNVTAVMHRFDNKQSLSHVKKLDDLLKYIDKLQHFVLITENESVKLAACSILADEWKSKRLHKALLEK